MNDDDEEILQVIRCKLCQGEFGVQIINSMPNEGLVAVGRAIHHHEQEHSETQRAMDVLADESIWDRYIFLDEDREEDALLKDIYNFWGWPDGKPYYE